MADIEGIGKSRIVYANGKHSKTDLDEVAAYVRNAAIRAVFALFGQDWDATGVKRAAFRPFAFCPIATSPASMSVRCLPGYVLANNGELLEGGWLSLKTDDYHDVVLDAAHATLDRYDVIYLQTTWALNTPTSMEFRDPATGNKYTLSSNKWALDAANFAVLKGTAGAGDPGVTRVDAYTLLPEWGQIPVAVVRVQAGATSIALTDIQDVREIFEIKRVQDDYGDNVDAIHQLGQIYPAMGIGCAAQAMDADGVAGMPRLTLFYNHVTGKFCIKDPLNVTQTLN